MYMLPVAVAHPLVTTLEYVMYFRFYGWHYVFTLCG